MANNQEARYIRYYTEGTIAYQIQPRQPERKKSAPPKARKQTVRVITVDPVAIGAIVLCVVMLVLMLNAVSVLKAEQAKLQVMTDYLYELEGQNTLLNEQYRQQVDLEAVEKRALALGMIPVEEARHITIQLPEVQEQTVEKEPTLWERVCTYFDGLFA